jgi:phosphatidylglycerophosphatase C
VYGSSEMSSELDNRSEHPAVVAFDFDGTLTTRDTLRLYLVDVKGMRHMVFACARCGPALAMAAFGGKRRDTAKEALTAALLKHLPRAVAEAKATQLAERIRTSLLRPDVVARMNWHLVQGHRVIVVSASFESYVRAVAESLGVSEVIATKWEVDEATDRLTGRLNGSNVRGENKVTCLSEHLGDTYILEYAYGNSSGDSAMLSAARHPIWVGKSVLSPVPDISAIPDAAPPTHSG